MLPSSAAAPSTPPRPKRTSAPGPYTPKTSASHQRQRYAHRGKLLRTPKSSPFIDHDGSCDGPYYDIPESLGASRPGHILAPDGVFSAETSPSTPQTLPGPSMFLPTPSTVGTGRKPRPEHLHMRPSVKSKHLLEKLQALSSSPVEEHPPHRSGQLLNAPPLLHGASGPHATLLTPTSSTNAHSAHSAPFSHSSHSNNAFSNAFSTRDFGSEPSNCDLASMSLFSSQPLKECSQDLHEVKNTPRTPSQSPILEQKARFESFVDSVDPVQIVHIEDLDKIPRVEIPNPFLDRKSDSSRFSARKHVDYSTHLEKFNSRTGERTVEPLSETQRKFKPRKLDFTSAVKASAMPDYKMANKYVESNIGKNFTMGETRPKGALDFDIFNDHE